MNGALLFVAVVLALVFVVLRGRAQRPLRKHRAVFGLLPISVIVAVASMDFGQMGANGIALNATPIIVLLLGLLPRRA